MRPTIRKLLGKLTPYGTAVSAMVAMAALILSVTVAFFQWTDRARGSVIEASSPEQVMIVLDRVSEKGTVVWVIVSLTTINRSGYADAVRSSSIQIEGEEGWGIFKATAKMHPVFLGENAYPMTCPGLMRCIETGGLFLAVDRSPVISLPPGASEATYLGFPLMVTTCHRKSSGCDRLTSGDGYRGIFAEDAVLTLRLETVSDGRRTVRCVVKKDDERGWLYTARNLEVRGWAAANCV